MSVRSSLEVELSLESLPAGSNFGDVGPRGEERVIFVGASAQCFVYSSLFGPVVDSDQQQLLLY